jgi:iron complex transport system permease protein
MVLAGIAILYIFSAMTTLVMFFADPDSVEAVYFWNVGTLDKADWDSAIIVTIVVIIASILLLLKAKEYNIINTGDESAKSLGVNVTRNRNYSLLIVSILTATIVSFTGTIGFVGLVSAHLCRIFIGADNRYLIPASGIFGGALLLGADSIARTIISPTVLPVGVITAFIGGPLFLYLIMKQRKSLW